MRKLIWLLILFGTILAFPGSAGADVICGRNFNSSAPAWANACYHWGDTARPTTIATKHSIGGEVTQWTTAISHGNSVWDADTSVFGFSAVSGGTCPTGTGGKNTICIYDYTPAQLCTPAPGGVSIACTAWYVYYEYDQPTAAWWLGPHIAYSVFLVDRIPNDTSFTWNDSRRKGIICHELGHVLGLNHTVDNPGLASCLHAYTNDQSAIVPGTDLQGLSLGFQANYWNNHNDTTCGNPPGACSPGWGNLSVKKTTSRKPMARVRLSEVVRRPTPANDPGYRNGKPYFTGEVIDGKRVRYIPTGYDMSGIKPSPNIVNVGLAGMAATSIR